MTVGLRLQMVLPKWRRNRVTIQYKDPCQLLPPTFLTHAMLHSDSNDPFFDLNLLPHTKCSLLLVFGVYTDRMPHDRKQVQKYVWSVHYFGTEGKNELIQLRCLEIRLHLGIVNRACSALGLTVVFFLLVRQNPNKFVFCSYFVCQSHGFYELRVVWRPCFACRKINNRERKWF